MADSPKLVVHEGEVEEITEIEGAWGSHYKVLTPAMRERGGKLGVALNRLPPGKTSCACFHSLRESDLAPSLRSRSLRSHSLRSGSAIRFAPLVLLLTPRIAVPAFRLPDPSS